MYYFTTRLRLRLASGEFEIVRKVLWKLRAALGDELHRVTSTRNSSLGANSEVVAQANYVEATETLVVQVMLPRGEFAEALTLVSSDPYLRQNEKAQLLEACELSASRQVELEPGSGGDAGVVGTPSRYGRCHSAGRTAGGAQGWGNSMPDNVESPSHTTRHGEQGPLQKFFGGVSDWTPEARLQLVFSAGAAGLAAYAACRHRGSLWRAVRGAAGLAGKTAGDIGTFIVGTS